MKPSPTVGQLIVTVSQWFGFASDNVPMLYKLYLGNAQDVKTYAEGTPFPVLPLEAK